MPTRLVLLLVLGWTSLASAAGVYKWVDAEGRTHYGENPPAGRPVQEMRLKDEAIVPSPPAGEAARRDTERRLLRAFEEERAAKKAEQQKRRDEQAAREQRCRQARERLHSHQSARGLYRLDPQGNRQILTDAERAAAEQRLQQAVAEWCD